MAKVKKKRAEKYDTKLAINGSFADVIKVSVSDLDTPKEVKLGKLHAHEIIGIAINSVSGVIGTKGERRNIPVTEPADKNHPESPAKTHQVERDRV